MSDLPDLHNALFCFGDELAIEPDDWIDTLLKSGALVEVTIDHEAAVLAVAKALDDEVSIGELADRVVAAAIGDTSE